MKLNDRYLAGQCEQVYEEMMIIDLATAPLEIQTEIYQVLTETFNRVSFNVNLIYTELKSNGYTFWHDRNSIEQARIYPSADTSQLLARLDQAVKPFGFLPLSLKFFYRIVGGTNLGWDYRKKEEILWEMADPLQIAPLQQVLKEVEDEEWLEGSREYYEEWQEALVDLAADSLHKDNISGGSPYGIEITRVPTVDALFLNEPHNTTFVNYLRICFDNCGFPGMAGQADQNGFQAYCKKVKPKLQLI